MDLRAAGTLRPQSTPPPTVAVAAVAAVQTTPDRGCRHCGRCPSGCRQRRRHRKGNRHGHQHSPFRQGPRRHPCERHRHPQLRARAAMVAAKLSSDACPTMQVTFRPPATSPAASRLGVWGSTWALGASLGTSLSQPPRDGRAPHLRRKDMQHKWEEGSAPCKANQKPLQWTTCRYDSHHCGGSVGRGNAPPPSSPEPPPPARPALPLSPTAE